MLKKILKVDGYSAYSRLLDQMTARPIGEIPRQENIPSPYRYSPTWQVYQWRWPSSARHVNKLVTIVETSHRTYTVFEVPRPMMDALATRARVVG